MKKILLLMVLVLTALTTNARVIWTGSQELDWNNNKFLQLDGYRDDDPIELLESPVLGEHLPEVL